jgi:hypothetical protein
MIIAAVTGACLIIAGLHMAVVLNKKVIDLSGRVAGVSAQRMNGNCLRAAHVTEVNNV